MLINNNQQFKFFPLLLFLITIAVLLFPTISTRSPYSVAAQTSPDAIAVRVIPNPEHYSAARWYREQGFAGSPQSLTVDGYEAIRDGRTVYVNAANIDDQGTPDPNDDTLYTNIYLISYNQKAKKPTVDIFAQILSHWQFNANISQTGTCSQTNTTACLKDTDCPLGEYCLSQKAKIIRDTKRLADLAEIKTALEKFKDKYHHYPTLKSGSYLPYKTISVWPSWQKTLAQELGFVPLPVDPVNKLGDCGEDRFNPVTCWDEKAKEFADANPSNATFDLPAGSKVYVYIVSPAGDNFNICGIMETTYTTVTEIGDCNTMGADIQVSGFIPNQSPRFIYFNLRGFSGQEYKGDIKATDPDGDTLTWTINIDPINQWANWHNGQPPVLQDISPTEKLLYSPAAGMEGVYQIEITLDDNRGQPNSIINRIFDITILNSPPVLNPINCIESVRVNNNYPPCYITATDIEGDDITFEFDGLPVGFNGDVNSGVITGLPPISAAGNYFIRIRAIDDNGGASQWGEFNLRINTYCGDGEIQAINGEGIREECDGNQEFCIIDGYNGQKDCQPDCTFGDCIPTESCGDGIVNGSEECDLNSKPCITFDGYRGQKDCQPDCTFGDCIPTESCGDGIVNGSEECDDGNNIDGDGCNTFSANCRWTCGDGIVNGSEECDPALSDIGEQCNILASHGIHDVDGSNLDCSNLNNNIIGSDGISNLYEAMCNNNCEIGNCGSTSQLGQGCYLGSSCQKGIYGCDVSGNIVCMDVFDPPKWDWCCESIINHGGVSWGQNQLSSFSLVRVKPSAAVSGSGNFNCDAVCHDYGLICAGVGLTDDPASYCYAVRCHSGNNCLLSSNTTQNDCRTIYPFLIDGDSCANPEPYHVGYTSCLCY